MEDDARSTLETLYRGEMQRTTTWRQRLDTTTNWAVIITAAVLTWTFSSPSNSHLVLLLAQGLVLAFAVVEARRYRRFDVWRSRVRLLEENLMAPAVDVHTTEKDGDWGAVLADDLQETRYKITMREAWARRMRRIYLWLMAFLLAAWLLKLALTAETALPGGLVGAATVGGVGGRLILGGVAVGYLTIVGITAWMGHTEREAKGTIKPKDRSHDWHEI